MVKVRSVESVLFSRYLCLCNVLRICNIRAIPSYRVYRLYDMKDLDQIERCTPMPDSSFDPSLNHITTPLKWESWERALSSHPDQAFSRYIVNGGFRIGYSYAKGLVPLNAQKNMLSAQQHQEVIDSYINQAQSAKPSECHKT